MRAAALCNETMRPLVMSWEWVELGHALQIHLCEVLGDGPKDPTESMSSFLTAYWTVASPDLITGDSLLASKEAPATKKFDANWAAVVARFNSVSSYYISLELAAYLRHRYSPWTV